MSDESSLRADFWTEAECARELGRSVYTVEDPVFGLRAAGPALLSNTSYFEQKICRWDPGKLVAS